MLAWVQEVGRSRATCGQCRGRLYSKGNRYRHVELGDTLFHRGTALPTPSEEDSIQDQRFRLRLQRRMAQDRETVMDQR